jgi:hypothetical protein
MAEDLRIELPIETERLVIRPLELKDAGDLGESEDWISEKVDRFERDGGMSLWAAVDRESGRAVALAGLQWEQIDGRRELDLGCVVAHDRTRQRGGFAPPGEAGVHAPRRGDPRRPPVRVFRQSGAGRSQAPSRNCDVRKLEHFRLGGCHRPFAPRSVASSVAECPLARAVLA